MHALVLIHLMAHPPVSLKAHTLAGWAYWPLEGAQGVAWSYTYAALIRRGAVDKYVGMPVVAMVLNLAWEFTYAFVLPTPSAQKTVNVVWVGLDLIICYQALKYGRKDYPWVSARIFPWAVAALLGYATVFHILLGREFADYYGIYGAQGINVYMSGAYINLLRRRGSSAGQSMHVAVAKCAGTFSVTLMFLAMFPERWLLLFFGLTVFALDLGYCTLLYRQIKAEGAKPWTGSGRRPAAATTAAPVPALLGTYLTRGADG